MSRPDLIAWVLSVTCALRLSQSKTLAQLAAAAVQLDHAHLALIGPKMAGPVTAQHTIRRTWRFTCNGRVEISDAMQGVLARLTPKRKQRLLVSFDWTAVRDFHTLMAAAAFRGRAVPLLWASSRECEFHRSQNSL